MQAKGEFMFKSITERAKGSFTDKETGEVVSFDACNMLVADEFLDDGSVKERRFKLDLKDDAVLSGEFSALDQYTKVEITFDVTLYASNARVKPVSFVEL